MKRLLFSTLLLSACQSSSSSTMSVEVSTLESSTLATIAVTETTTLPHSTSTHTGTWVVIVDAHTKTFYVQPGIAMSAQTTLTTAIGSRRTTASLVAASLLQSVSTSQASPASRTSSLTSIYTTGAGTSVAPSTKSAGISTAGVASSASTSASSSHHGIPFSLAMGIPVGILASTGIIASLIWRYRQKRLQRWPHAYELLVEWASRNHGTTRGFRDEEPSGPAPASQDGLNVIKVADGDYVSPWQMRVPELWPGQQTGGTADLQGSTCGGCHEVYELEDTGLAEMDGSQSTDVVKPGPVPADNSQPSHHVESATGDDAALAATGIAGPQNQSGPSGASGSGTAPRGAIPSNVALSIVASSGIVPLRYAAGFLAPPIPARRTRSSRRIARPGSIASIIAIPSIIITPPTAAPLTAAPLTNFATGIATSNVAPTDIATGIAPPTNVAPTGLTLNTIAPIDIATGIVPPTNTLPTDVATGDSDLAAQSNEATNLISSTPTEDEVRARHSA